MKEMRRLLLGSVALQKGRLIGEAIALSKILNEFDSTLEEFFFQDAPFDRISIILYYGDATDLVPKYDKLYKANIVEIPASVNLNMSLLKRANDEEIYHILRYAVSEVIVDIGQKYKLPIENIDNNKDKEVFDSLM